MIIFWGKMATLNNEKIKQGKRKKQRFVIGIIVPVVIIAPYLAFLIDQILKGALGKTGLNYSIIDAYKIFFDFSSMSIVHIWTLAIITAWIGLIVYSSMTVEQTITKVDTIKLFDDVEIPVAAGNGQHGTARFLKENEKDNIFASFSFSGKEKLSTPKGGLVVEMKKEHGIEKIRYVSDDYHAMIIGSTGCGKSRRMLFETVWLQILSGSSVVVSDMKGEIFYYTHEYAEQKGYKALPLDLRNPRKSVHYNFLQPIIDAFDEGDEAKAIDYTWDLVSVLVGESKGEPLWYNGETATIAAAILAVVLEAPDNCKNMANVYHFIANMCKSNEMGEMLISSYLENLPDTHPAKTVFAMATIAAEKTRSSFFTSALGTLRLFTNPNIAEMTSKSDFSLADLGREKTILYMMVPDDKKTYYPLVSILITQMYSIQVELANEYGGRLPVNIDYDLDEIGNFPFIPSLSAIHAAGRSRGVRVYSFWQDFQQLKTKYKDDYENIKSNCRVHMFLMAVSDETLKEMSDSLGKYTVEVSSASTSATEGKKNSANYSSSASLAARALLEPNEVAKIKAPWAIVKVAGENPGIVTLPDLSEYRLNQILGLGDMEHNSKIIMEREAKRPQRDIPELILWGIWNEIKDEIDSYAEKGERVIF